MLAFSHGVRYEEARLSQESQTDGTGICRIYDLVRTQRACRILNSAASNNQNRRHLNLIARCSTAGLGAPHISTGKRREGATPKAVSFSDAVDELSGPSVKRQRSSGQRSWV